MTKLKRISVETSTLKIRIPINNFIVELSKSIFIKKNKSPLSDNLKQR